MTKKPSADFKVDSIDVGVAMSRNAEFACSALSVLADFGNATEFASHMKNAPNPEKIRDFYTDIAILAERHCEIEEDDE